MEWRRVVITGMGVTCPAGTGLDTLWANLMAGKSGLGRLARFDPEGYPCQVAGEVTDLEFGDYLNKKDQRRFDRCIQLAVAAGQMAMDDAGLAEGGYEPERSGTIIGSGIGGIHQFEANYKTLVERGPTKVSPFMIPMLIPNMSAGIVSLRHNLQGPNAAPSTACSSGTHGIGDGFRIIQRGDADLMLAGGAESPLTSAAFAGFCTMRAMCTDHNDDPVHASRPFDKTRSGFIMGEGAGLVVLEERERALARGARIYAEVTGYGMSGDAHHFTSPAPGGAGAARAMKRALEVAEAAPESVDYVNAHGTSTQLNDASETQALKTVFGDYARKLAISSTKSHMGHLLGAAGGVEAIVCVLAMQHGAVPPTINYEVPDPECDLDYVPNTGREMRVRRVLTNSFAFGGTNACLIIDAP